MDRISTNTAYGSVLANLMAAELRQTQAGNQLSSTTKASDLKGYGASAETLAAMQATNTSVSGFLQQTQVVGAKLSTQDQALNELADSAEGARQAITDALASGDGTTLMQSLQNFFQNSVEALNTTYNGHYLFAGGQVTTQPVTATTLSDLTSGPALSSFFHNDQRQTTTQLDGTTSVSSSFLADSLGTGLFTVFQTLQAFATGPNGPFTGTLTAAQKTFLTSEIASFDTQHTDLVNITAQNGLMQSQVTAAQTSLTQRQTMLGGLIGNLTGADLAKASTDLQQAQLAVQAAGQVFLSLKASSLLNTLSASGVP
jgi:flagellar hook-associated protein 3 FlgL